MDITISDQNSKLSFKYLKERIFTTTASKVGDFKIQARLDNVNSNIVEIHIYQKMALSFEEINLAPGCFTFLQLHGGPTENQM